MSGNVCEWCEDLWHDDYNGAPKDGSAWLSGGIQNRRVVRGGSWNDYGFECYVDYRNSYDADNLSNYIGFRLAGY